MNQKYALCLRQQLLLTPLGVSNNYRGQRPKESM